MTGSSHIPKMTTLLDALPLSSWQYLDLKCSVRNRRQFLTALHQIFSTDTTNGLYEEIYSYFLQVEIEDLLGPSAYTRLEKHLISLPDITEFVPALVFARTEEKHSTLKLMLSSNQLDSFFQEVSLPKRIAMSVEDICSSSSLESCRQLVIALMQQQLDDMLCGIDISPILHQYLDRCASLPPTLGWTRLSLKICCGLTKEICVSPKSACPSAEKEYVFRYPNLFCLSLEGKDKLETLLRGDLILSRLAFRLFPSSRRGDRKIPGERPREIFPSYDDILRMASKKYIDKLGSANNLRVILSLLPESSFDRMSIQCLRRDLLSAYRPRIPIVRNVSQGQIDRLCHIDPDGFLTIIAFSIDQHGHIEKQNFEMMLEQRYHLLNK